MTVTCRDCGRECERHPKYGHQCKPCRRVYQRGWERKRRAEGKPTGGFAPKEWWATYRQLPIVKQKSAARSASRAAVAKGLIERKPCRDCGSVKVEIHHADYSQPFNIVWLCKRCHWNEHLKADGAQ